MNQRIFVLLLAAWVAGCSARHRRGDGWYIYDDPRFTEEECTAVRAATEVVHAETNERADVPQAYRYTDVRRTNDGWGVTVIFVRGFDAGKPRLHTGGYMSVYLDGSFGLLRTTRGY